MYHPGMTQNNNILASMQRTFYAKHTHYNGDGQGRDSYITTNNGGLIHTNDNIVPKIGVTFSSYNTRVHRQ
jgi:hypothetical protein